MNDAPSPSSFFDAPLHISEGDPVCVDLLDTPYFYNDNGCPRYVAKLPNGIESISPAPCDPEVALGNEYVVSPTNDEQRFPGGVARRLDFEAEQLVYQPLKATRQNAAAFGMTLVEKGQGIQVVHKEPPLSQVTYVYGAFAAHGSPYHGRGKALLPVACTDLERHDFPHVFASVDPKLPLVISVARYWPQQRRIRLADLWLPIGSALYVPAQRTKGNEPCLDLHGNRNSARACWGSVRQDSIVTHTLLSLNDRSFHWFWNDLPTVHSNLEPK